RRREGGEQRRDRQLALPVDAGVDDALLVDLELEPGAARRHQVRGEDLLRAQLENLRRAQAKIIPRSWALRQLLELALAYDRPSRAKRPRPARSQRSIQPM